VITRLWRGWTASGDGDAYEHFLLEEMFPAMCEIAGFRGAEVLRRRDGDEVAFVTLTRFECLEALRAFAGEDFAQAVIEPRARRLLSHHGATAEHYESATFEAD